MRNSSATCVDANLIVRLVAEPKDEPVWQLWQVWEAERRPIAAPALLRYEVTNALYQAQRHGLRSARATREALRTALLLPLRLHDDPGLHGRAVDIATRFSLSAAYDAHYLALADSLGSELWTADKRLANKVRHALPWVHLVE